MLGKEKNHEGGREGGREGGTIYIKKNVISLLSRHLKTRYMCAMFLPPCVLYFDGHSAVAIM